MFTKAYQLLWLIYPDISVKIQMNFTCSMILTDSSSLEWPFPHVLVVYQLIVHWQWSIDIPWYPVIYPELHYSIIRWIQLSNVPPNHGLFEVIWADIMLYLIYMYIYIYPLMFTIHLLSNICYIYIYLKYIYIIYVYTLYIYTSFIYIYYPLLSNTVCWGTLGNSPPASRLMILISSLRRWASRLPTVVEQTEWYPMVPYGPWLP